MKTVDELIAIIDETVEFYGADPQGRRATALHADGGGETCVYYTEDGRKCAVGRLLDGETAKEWVALKYGPVGSIPDVELPGGLRHSFLRPLQILHDAPSLWASQGLSGNGESYVEEFKGRIRNNPGLFGAEVSA